VAPENSRAGDTGILQKDTGIQIAGHRYTASCPLIIAELGTGHNASLSRAEALIDAAASAGADCVKTQIVFADEILHPASGLVPLPGGEIPLYDVFKRLEAGPEFFARMKEKAESCGLLFLASPFGPRSAALLRELKPAAVKIASPELNHISLLQTAASWHIPTLLSTGVSTLADIEEALEVWSAAPCSPLPVLLHCVTAYPAPASEYNLAVMRNMAAVFGVPVGVSDHSGEAALVPALSAACGGCVIEKHFCLSRADGGLDDPIALPHEEFAKMTAFVRKVASLESASERLAAVEAVYGAAAVREALGDGVKRLAPSEAANYGRTNRSLHALHEIEAGEVITESDFAALRTEKVLRPGLAPRFAGIITGRRAKTYIPAGEGIRWEDLC